MLVTGEMEGGENWPVNPEGLSWTEEQQMVPAHRAVQCRSVVRPDLTGPFQTIRGCVLFGSNTPADLSVLCSEGPA